MVYSYSKFAVYAGVGRRPLFFLIGKNLSEIYIFMELSYE